MGEQRLHWRDPTHYEYRSTTTIRLPFFRQTRTELSSGVLEGCKVQPTRYPKGQDALSYQLQLALDLEKNPEKKQFEYAIVSKTPTRHYRFTRIGKEIVNTPLGRLQVVHLRSQHDPHKRTDLWLARSLHYVPVQFTEWRRGRQTFSGTLQAIRFEE